MECKARVKYISPTINGADIILHVDGAPDMSGLDTDSVMRLTLVKWRERRSSDANRYAWALIGKIADVNRASKDEVYFEMLKRYGQSQLVSVLSSVDVSRYIKYYEPIANVTLQGKEFTHYRVYAGSSEYDTREMAIFIDGIVSEAKELGIDTMTTTEIEQLKQKWGVNVG